MTEHKERKVKGDIFNMGALKVFAALDGKTVEEEAQHLLNLEEEMANGQGKPEKNY